MNPLRIGRWCRVLMVAIAFCLAGCSASQAPKSAPVDDPEVMERFRKMQLPDDWLWAKSHIPRYTIRNSDGRYVRIVTQKETDKAHH